MAEAAKKLNYRETFPASQTVQNNKNKLKQIRNLKKRRRFLVLIYLSFLAISIASAIFMLSNYEKITSLNFEIRNINAIIVESKKTELNLKAKVEEIKSDRDIVEEARTKLGMIFPDNNQVIYFTLRDTEKAQEDEGLISTIFSTFTGNRK